VSSTPSSPSSSPRLSLICPTIGRSTFARLLKDVLYYIGAEDEFVVVGDGPCPNVREQIEALADARFRYVELAVRANDWGCTPCDVGVQNATGDMVWFIGDDDELQSHAFDVVRAGVTGATDKAHIFAMKHTGILMSQSIAFCKVSGQQIVAPRENLPKMADYAFTDWYRTDWSFITRTVDKFGGPVYHDEVICLLPQMNQGAML